MGRGKRLDRVLQRLVPGSVLQEVIRVGAVEGGRVVAVDDDVVIPWPVDGQARLYGPVEQELGFT